MEAVIAERMLPFMFLGGALDHTTRRVPVDGPLGTPGETYEVPVSATVLPWMTAKVRAATPGEVYARHRVSSGNRSWWCYVREGHEPSRRALLDACPWGAM